MHSVSLQLRQFILAWERFRQTVLERAGLSVSDGQALGFLFLEGSLTPSELGSRLRLTSGSVTAMIDRLDRGGLIERRQNPDDKRSVLVALTTRGERYIKWFYELVDENVERAAHQLDGAPLPQISEFLETISGELVATSEDPSAVEPPN